jgi:hypothetical protein
LHLRESLLVLGEEAVILVDVLDGFEKVIVSFVSRGLGADQVIVRSETGIGDSDDEGVLEKFDEDGVLAKPFIGPLTL